MFNWNFHLGSTFRFAILVTQSSWCWEVISTFGENHHGFNDISGVDALKLAATKGRCHWSDFPCLLLLPSCLKTNIYLVSFLKYCLYAKQNLIKVLSFPQLVLIGLGHVNTSFVSILQWFGTESKRASSTYLRTFTFMNLFLFSLWINFSVFIWYHF